MWFRAYKSVPANTTRDNPTWQKLRIMPGEIIGWIIFSDPEAADQLYYRIEYHNSQLVPAGESEYLNAFLTSHIVPESILIDDPEYNLDIYAYNTDDRHPHEYFIHPIIMPNKPYKPTETSSMLLDRLRDIFRLR